MWLDKLKELKKGSKMSSKQIADATGIPESTIKRIFAGDTDNPYVDTLHRIVTVLGGSLDEIFAETKAVVSSTTLGELQTECDKLKAEIVKLQEENAKLEDKNFILLGDIGNCHLTISLKEDLLKQKDEIIALQKEIITLYKSN